MLWLELNEQLMVFLWANETLNLLNIFRKLFFDQREGMDAFDVAYRYITTTFIFDFMATVPTIVSFLNPRLLFLKLLRFVDIQLLQYPLEQLVSQCLCK